MITGSHIPENRNGIKYYKQDGEVLKSDEEGIIAKVASIRREEYAKSANETLFDAGGMFKIPVYADTVSEEAKKTYIRRYLDVFPPDCFWGKTIIVFQHSAVGRDMLAYVLESLGAEVIPVKRSDEFIAIDTENITTQDRELFRLLADKYKQKHPFAIVSTDGDSDRPFVIDEKGEVHRGDVLGMVVCQYLKAKFAAVPISVNDAIDIQCKKNRIKLNHTKIGSPYVIKAMEEAITEGESRVVSWEVNGGFLTGTDFSISGSTLKALPTRDAFLPILGALAQATNRDIAVSKLFVELPYRYTDAGVLDNLPQDIQQKIISNFSLPDESDIQQVSFKAGAMRVTNFTNSSRILNSMNPVGEVLLSIKQGLERFFNSKLGFSNISSINYLDGIRITFANGDIAHIRPSGNAPQFRVYSNADSQERASEIVRLSIAEPDGIIQQMKKGLTNTDMPR
jgi:phosphomannomutase